MENDNTKNFVHKMSEILKTQVKDVLRKISESDKDWDGFEEGRLIGYYSIISMLKNYAEFHGLNQNDINLADIDPDKDIMSDHKKSSSDSN